MGVTSAVSVIVSVILGVIPQSWFWGYFDGTSGATWSVVVDLFTSGTPDATEDFSQPSTGTASSINSVQAEVNNQPTNQQTGHENI